jgi:hypothetical protein
MTMRLYLRTGLALVIAIGFLMSINLLSPEATSALIKQPKVKVESVVVRPEAFIHPPNSGIEKAKTVAGEINGNFSPGDSATTQFANSGLSLLGTELIGTGPGAATVKVTQTGPESFRTEFRSILNNMTCFEGAVTTDRSETRLICDSVSGKVTCPVQSVVFENLKVNGVSQPYQSQPNTEYTFNKQVTIGGFPVNAAFKVVLSPLSFKEQGGRTVVSLGSYTIQASGPILVGLMRRHGEVAHPGKYISYNEPESLLSPSRADRPNSLRALYLFNSEYHPDIPNDGFQRGSASVSWPFATVDPLRAFAMPEEIAMRQQVRSMGYGVMTDFAQFQLP